MHTNIPWFYNSSAYYTIAEDGGNQWRRVVRSADRRRGGRPEGIVPPTSIQYLETVYYTLKQYTKMYLVLVLNAS